VRRKTLNLSPPETRSIGNHMTKQETYLKVVKMTRSEKAERLEELGNMAEECYLTKQEADEYELLASLIND